MRTIREIARLHLSKQLSLRAIAGMADKELQERLRPLPSVCAPRPEPDIAQLVAELKQSRSKVNRQLLHEEYLAQHPDGYKKTRFYELIQAWQQQDEYTGESVPLIQRQNVPLLSGQICS